MLSRHWPIIVGQADNDAPEPAGWQWRGLRTLFLQIPDPLLALAGRSSQVAEWDRSHRYCGRCGTPTLDKPDERAKQCPACGHVVYPRVSPAMMVLVTRGRELLLARANRLGIGPQGYGGDTTAFGIHILTYPCHITSLPVAVTIECHAHRHKEVTL